MSDLLKVSELRSRMNPGLSLLHHLLRETQQQDRDILTFVQELEVHLPNIVR